jgi:hypothetical protein
MADESYLMEAAAVSNPEEMSSKPGGRPSQVEEARDARREDRHDGY